MGKYRVFVSYTMRGNGVSVELLQSLKNRLNKHGLIETYIDILDNSGEDHQAYVEEQLRKANVVLLIKSDDIESSTWVKRELSIAREYNIPILVLSLEQLKSITDAKSDMDWLEKELIQLSS